MTAGSDALEPSAPRPWWRWRRASGGRWRRQARVKSGPIGARTPAAARTRFGGDDREGELVTVYTARTPEEAWVVCGRLIAHDVPAMVDRTTGGSVWGEGVLGVGVAVAVPRAMVERAEAVLAHGDDDASGRRDAPHA